MTADTEAMQSEGTQPEEGAPAETAPAAGKQKPTLPEGIVSPITALNALKQKGVVPADYKPQQMYGHVKSPGKTDPFPVKHYDATGQVYDSAQVNEHGITVTRPGVVTAEIETWWGRKGERDAAKAKEKAEKAAAKKLKEEEKAKAAAAGAVATTEGTPEAASDEAGELVDAGEFEEAQ